jgi:O-antigen ligase
MGHGYGAYWNAKNVLAYSDQFEWHIPHAHNAYIDLTLAVGGVGLAFYLLWVASSAGAALARYERSGRPAELFVMSFLLMTLVHGATESKIPGAGVGALMQLAVMAALIVHPPWPSRASVAASRAGSSPSRPPLPRRPHVPPRILRRLEGSA